MRKSVLFLVFICLSATAAASESLKKEEAADSSLKRVMQQLAFDYVNLSRAILLEDFEAAEASAHAIAFHDKPSMGQRMKIIAALGTEMASFKQADERVHQLAVKAEDAARARDMRQLISYQSQMLDACMNCHQPYRKRVMALGLN